MRWAEVEEYVAAVRALLRGEEASWNGSLVRLTQPAGLAAGLPADVAVLIAADGPRGRAVAAELGDGVLTTRAPRATGCRATGRAGLAAGAADLRHRPRRGRGRGRPAGGRGRRPRRGRRLPRHLRVEGRRRGGPAAGRPRVAGGGRGGRAAPAAPRDPRRPPDRARPARPGAARPRGAAARELDHDRNADRHRRPAARADRRPGSPRWPTSRWARTSPASWPRSPRRRAWARRQQAAHDDSGQAGEAAPRAAASTTSGARRTPPADWSSASAVRAAVARPRR